MNELLINSKEVAYLYRRDPGLFMNLRVKGKVGG